MSCRAEIPFFLAGPSVRAVWDADLDSFDAKTTGSIPA
jgi:hypothetical protein